MAQIEALRKSRAGHKGSITRIETWFRTKCDTENNYLTYETKLELLHDNFAKFSKVQEEIEQIDQGDREREMVEELYFQLIVELKGKIKQIMTSQMQTQVNAQNFLPGTSHADVKLPQINIKPFKGDTSEWTSFFQLFDAVVMKNYSLSDIQRFIYLKSFLRDEPLKLIDNLNVTNDNFKTALEILQKRYENNVSVINSYFVSLLEVSPLTKCTAAALREFVTNCKRNLDSLRNLNHSDKRLFEFLLIYLLGRKLDFGTRKAFEMERDVTELPDLEEFFEFIEKRCIVLENLSSTGAQPPKVDKSQPRSQPRTSLHVQVSPARLQCAYCNDTSHKIYSCEKFGNLSPKNRRDAVDAKRLCFNCLGNAHIRSQCTSTRVCSICSQKHHTWLHLSQGQGPQNLGNRNSKFPRDQNGSVSQRGGFHSQGQVRNVSQDGRHQNNGASQNKNVGVQDRQDAHVSCNNFRRSSNSDNSQEASLSISALSTRNSQVLLMTAIVSIKNAQGQAVHVRAVLDNGSQNSFVTERLVKKLEYIPYSKPLRIAGIGLASSLCQQMVELTLFSTIYAHTKFKVSCVVLPLITSQLPQTVIDVSSLKIPAEIMLSDPSFAIPADIDLLIGADLYYDLLTHGTIQLGKNLPTLLNTHLGWVVGGVIPSKCNPGNLLSHLNTSLVQEEVKSTVALFVNTEEHEDLEIMVSRFWMLEEIPHSKKLSLSDQKAEEIFKETTRILENGQFQVNLPLKSPLEDLKLGDSFFIAKKRFLNLESRFKKDTHYYTEYKKFIEEYVDLGHGKYVPLALTNELNSPKYFLPHHAVIREDSITTKVRVVFDASCKSSSGLSLNDVTLKGFQVQPDLYDILCRFRSYKYTLTCDIEKMFRQILVNPDQRHLLNILWRNHSTESLQCIELSTVTYGTNCAPFLATRVLNELAQRRCSEFPLASEAILKMTYVDDVLGGTDDVASLETLYNQLLDLLGAHNFQLHKWRSNSGSFLAKISQKVISERDLNLDESPNKVLGLKWNSVSDFFCVSIPDTISQSPTITKRKILSIIAQCYDPIGFLSPVIVTGKLIVQKLWMLKVNWDTPVVDESLLHSWKEFHENLPLLKCLKIPRYLFLDKPIAKIEIHGFADSSMLAYAACVYVRTIYIDGSASCILMSSKSRVAPLKTVTLPRLELCAMLLLAQLVTKLLTIYEDRFQRDSVNLWTDSQIALYWVNSHPSRWNVFVSNRVAQIQELTSKFSWRHVGSADNPADIPSRGVPVREVINMDLWWHGPKFLLDQRFDVTRSGSDRNLDPHEIPEERKIALVTLRASDANNYWCQLFSKFSCFLRLQRTVAYMFRFIDNLKNSKDKRTGSLEVCELTNALDHILKTLQNVYFTTQIRDLKQGKVLSDKQLQKLKPFIDHDGFLRVGGRLDNANVSFNQKHPILLPSRNHVVSLMLVQQHQRLGHAGSQTTLSNFRLRYWPLNGLREVKRIIGNCITCFRFKAQPARQVMADLPRDRVREARCFSKVGVDYGGPFLIKSSKLRKAPVVKAYLAIFVCMVTKAVHIELVTSLSTEGFLMTLNRFIARRGNPITIYSDNATNFLGARNQLRELYEFFQKRENSASIKEFLSKNEIEFRFIPPRSPHWGGIWESAVKSAKYHLVRLIGEALLTFEEMYTILTQIEAVMNSRPLCPLSDDPSDLQALTPGHFLTGSSLTAHPDRDVTQTPVNRLSLWNKLSQTQQLFWKRWKVDYLNRLQHRPKWYRDSRNIEVGMLVLLVEENSPPLRWPLGRITEVIPGKDGKIRLVRLKTQNGVFLRSIVKVCPLPTADAQEESQ